MKKYIGIIFVILLLLAPGCGRKDTAPEPKAPDAPPPVEKALGSAEIVANMQQLGESIISFQGIMDISTDFNGTLEVQQYKLWYSNDNRYRMEWETETEGKTVTVSDGENVWHYNEKEKIAYVVRNDVDFVQDDTFIQDLFGQLQEPNELFSFSYMDVTEVEGRRAYILKVTPKEYDLGVFFTWWIDAETWFPFKTETVLDGMISTVQFREMVFNPALGDAVFTFTAPEGVELVDLNEIFSQ
jgi:outer membrane lipoprotein-sorting protein